MRRVVITGIGIVSSIGNTAAEVEASLRAGKSGIVFAPDYAEHGFRCRVHGQPNIVLEDHIDKRDLRFMGDGAAYTFIAMDQAVKDCGLSRTDVSNDRTGIIVGSGGPSTKSFFKAHNIVRETGAPKRIGPFGVTKGMSSTVSACLATPFKIRGVNYSITSACSTSAHCIGNGTELIQMGKQDIVFAGGGEELDWTLSCLFDAMGAMSSQVQRHARTAPRAPMTPTATALSSPVAAASWCWKNWNTPSPAVPRSMAKSPATAPPRTATTWSPPAAKAANARCGWRCPPCRRAARSTTSTATAPSTMVGDVTEVEAIRRVFGHGSTPPIASTKSLTGHCLGGAGVWEAIYSLIMMNGNFIAASANVETLDPALDPAEIVTTMRDNVQLDSVLSNSFGFGGTNATLVMSKYLG